MKTILLTCNYCDQKISENSEFIELGSMNHNDFYYRNHSKLHQVGKMITMSNHSSLHFCNENCFTNHFFGRTLKDKS